MKNFLLGILATAILLGSGFYFYQLGKNSNQNTMTAKTGPTPAAGLVGNNKDSHGCIGSAGYIWCSYKNKCLREWEEGCPVPEDTDLIKGILYKKNNWPEGSVTVKITKNDGIYANGTANGEGGGGYFYAAKVNGAWEIVADGNGIISCATMEKYPKYPATLIPSCYDDKTGKLVTR